MVHFLMMLTVIFYLGVLVILRPTFVIEPFSLSTLGLTFKCSSIYKFGHKEWVELLINVPIYYFIHAFDSQRAIIDTLLFLRGKVHIDWLVGPSQLLDVLVVVVLLPSFNCAYFPTFIGHISYQLPFQLGTFRSKIVNYHCLLFLVSSLLVFWVINGLERFLDHVFDQAFHLLCDSK